MNLKSSLQKQNIETLYFQIMPGHFYVDTQWRGSRYEIFK